MRGRYRYGIYIRTLIFGFRLLVFNSDRSNCIGIGTKSFEAQSFFSLTFTFHLLLYLPISATRTRVPLRRALGAAASSQALISKNYILLKTKL